MHDMILMAKQRRPGLTDEVIIHAALDCFMRLPQMDQDSALKKAQGPTLKAQEPPPAPLDVPESPKAPKAPEPSTKAKPGPKPKKAANPFDSIEEALGLGDSLK